jgi:hypothetical protein
MNRNVRLMNRNEKAIANLETLDIQAKLENYTVYVIIGDNELELSDFEIEYQANEFDKKKEEEYLDN